jgi:hypothetical protein
MSRKTSAKEKFRTQVVITNPAGEIIATADPAEQAGSESKPLQKLDTGITALQGQAIHIIEMPEAFFRCKSAIEKHRWLSSHRVVHNPGPRLIQAYGVRPTLP